MVFEYRLRVRYADTDQMGVVYYANYLRFYEIGRVELIRALGYSYAELEDRGIMLPVLECNCKYISPAKYDEELIIKTWVSSFKGAKIEFKYEIYSYEKGVSINMGNTVHAFVGKDLKPLRLRLTDAEFAEKIEEIVEA